MSKLGRRKVRINITIEERLYKQVVDSGIIRRRELSPLIGQLLQSYMDLGSINALDDEAYDILNKYITKAMSEFRNSVEERLDRMERLDMEKYVLLALLQEGGTLDEENQKMVQQSLDRLKTKLEIDEDTDYLYELKGIVSRIKPDSNIASIRKEKSDEKDDEIEIEYESFDEDY